MGLRISDKHGVNPSIGKCFWCGEDSGEIILFGKLRDDVEAPRTCMINYEPCTKCEEAMALGVTLVVVSPKPVVDNQAAIHPGHYPTGKWFVVTEDAIRRFVQPEHMVLQILETKKAFVPQEVVDMLGLENVEPTHKNEEDHG